MKGKSITFSVEIIFDWWKLALALIGVFVNYIHNTFHHLLFVYFITNYAQTSPIRSCPYFNYSSLVDTDIVGFDFETSKNRGQLAESLKTLIIGVDGIWIG